jgi:carboxypeptidase Q
MPVRLPRALRAACAVALLLPPVVPVAARPQAGDAARRLAERAVGGTPLMDDLRELCDTIGGRATGSPACARAVEWATRKFAEAGVDSVKAEPFRMPALWLPGRAEAECLAPARFPVRIAAAPLAVSTPGGRPLVARVVDAGEGTKEAFARLGAKARGAIVLVRSTEMKSIEDLFAEYLRNNPVVEAARKAGAVALLFQSTRPRGLLYRHPASLMPTQVCPLPAAVVAREHAARLARLCERGEVRMRLTLANRTGGAYTSHNVVAEIRGREKPDEVVLLGAHLDSWDMGTGADDNGVNCALVIDVARGIKALGLRPRRTIRFVLFTGEEQGLVGSRGYVESHAAELDRHAAALIFDIGSGRVDGFMMNGRPELDAPLKEALAAAGLPAPNNVPDGVDGTDNFDFLLSGVPNLVANQDAGPYLPNYHAESDTLDKVDAESAARNAAIAAAAVWGLAERADRPAARQTRAEVDALLKATKLDEQMKAFGQWSEWAAGKRGADRKE